MRCTAESPPLGSKTDSGSVRIGRVHPTDPLPKGGGVSQVSHEVDLIS